jgi:hypothetical protein
MLNEEHDEINDNLPDSKIPWFDNEYEGVYSEDPEDGYPYDVGSKVQE